MVSLLQIQVLKVLYCLGELMYKRGHVYHVDLSHAVISVARVRTMFVCLSVRHGVGW